MLGDAKNPIADKRLITDNLDIFKRLSERLRRAPPSSLIRRWVSG